MLYIVFTNLPCVDRDYYTFYLLIGVVACTCSSFREISFFLWDYLNEQDSACTQI